MAKKTKAAKQQFRLTCMYCDRAGSSREHYFSTWMHPYFAHLAQRVTPRNFNGKVDWEGDDTGANVVERSTGRSRVHDPVRQVCETCNNGWMSDIVKQSQPAIERWCLPSGQGRDGAITPDCQRDMATWAALTSISYVTAKAGPGRIMQFDRDHIARTSTLPPFWRVAMARIDAPESHALIVQNSTAGYNRQADATFVSGGPWIMITLIDALFMVWRETRGAPNFLDALTVAKPVTIHPARSTELLWEHLPLYEGNVGDMLMEQSLKAAEASIMRIALQRATRKSF